MTVTTANCISALWFDTSTRQYQLCHYSGHGSWTELCIS